MTDVKQDEKQPQNIKVDFANPEFQFKLVQIVNDLSMRVQKLEVVCEPLYKQTKIAQLEAELAHLRGEK